jgi:predicted Abi (CAAX) family protease
MHRRWFHNLGSFALLVYVTLGFILLGHAQDQRPPIQVSNYAIASQAPFHQPSYYPLKQTVDTMIYQPVGDWVGRLILPPAPQKQDWVWLQVYHAPSDHQDLTGQTVRLEWDSTAQPYIQAATRVVNFSAEVETSQRKGNIHPARLNHRRVGPLQSLAGAHPHDDIIVTVAPTIVRNAGDRPTLKIAVDPVQVPERYYTVVKIIRPLAAQSQDIPTPCLDQESCPWELFEVRHYRPASQAFDGPQEIIRIPQVTADRNGVYRSTIHKLKDSPAGAAGWYVYGAKNTEGVFVAVAIAPRSLFDLQPDRVLTGKPAARRSAWKQSISKKGTAHSVLTTTTAKDTDSALRSWQLGNQALVLHLFGGIGGQKAEPQSVIGTVTGHFAFGIAQVIRDPLTQALRFQLQYQQVYSHNPEGIIAGSMQWAEYLGNLQRGWLGTRPMTDVLVKLPAITEDYNFDGTIISPMGELQRQLQLMAARYRTGDGTGAALVTPAKSCAQDSSQAVYTTVKIINEQIRRSPKIQVWLQTHPQHPQTERFQALVALGNRLERELVPLGIVRPDWQQNAEVLAGIRPQRGFTNQDNIVTQILSWRTIVPRVVHDQLTDLFRDSGAQLWFLRTNQVGGWDVSIAPLEATELLGQWPIITRIFSRLIDALTTFPNGWGWLTSGGILLVYASMALSFGWRQGFLKRRSAIVAKKTILTVGLGTFLTPALFEELLFRALLIPHPHEDVWLQTTILWACISLALFIVYHPIHALTAYRRGAPTFFQPTFLILAGLLGLACTLTYLLTSSLWPGVVLHWLVVVVWLLRLGGLERLNIN